MKAESAFQPSAISPKGAIGLMQLMPDTARMLGVDPHDPAQNVDAGVRYLRTLIEKYGGGIWHALAAYNAGAGTLDKLLARSQTRSFDAVAPRLPAETPMYVPRVEAVLLRREGVTLAQLER